MPPLVPGFGSMTPTQMIRLLQREFGYVVVRKTGSHHFLKAPGRPRISIAVHAKAFGPSLVRDILVKQVGVSLEKAREVVGRG